MGHYMTVTINAICKKSEFEEIVEGFRSGIINWKVDPTVNSIYDRKPLLYYCYKITPVQPDEGCLENLSEMYPLVSFSRNSEYEDPEADEDEFGWCCCGKNCTSMEIDALLATEYQKSVYRSMQSDSKHAFGLYHQLHCEVDGTVESSGQNIFGECNSQEWTDICAVACGDWHSVALKRNGTLVACGSNANHQCDVDNLLDTVCQISCGRYHTAILYQNGDIDVRGKLEHIIEDKFLERNSNISGIKYPVIRSVEGPASKKRNRRIENTNIGDFLELRIDEDNPSYYPVGVEVLNCDGESLGYLEDDNAAPITLIAHDLAKIKAHVNSVTPLSAQYPGARYALMTVCLEESGVITPETPQYHQIPYRSWNNIIDICSVHDAVIGKDTSGEIYVDGDPGCSVSELNAFLIKRFRKQGE